jgi:hypothetical protein
MVDIEDVGVQVLFDKIGDKSEKSDKAERSSDGSIHTGRDGLGEWAFLEQGLLKIPEPFGFKGVCIVKRAMDTPVTSEPVMYGYARCVIDGGTP